MSREEEIFDAAQEFCKNERMNTVCDCFTAGAKWADAHPKAISRNEKLPPIDEEVIGFYPHGFKGFVTRKGPCFCGLREAYDLDGIPLSPNGGELYAWCPIPKAD